MPKPIISIVTPSYNRSVELDLLIKSICEQNFDLKMIELIISDDGSTDDTEKVVKGWAIRTEFELKYLNQKNQGPGRARNHGMEHSVGDLILFIDSDCEADSDWIKNIYDCFLKENFDACGGPDGARGDFSLLQKAIDFSMTSFLTTGGMRGHSKNMIAKFYPRTHNMGLKKKVFEKIGGFGNLRHGQDIEYSNRILSNGSKITFVPDALVYHRRRTTIRQFFKQVFNWGVARINLFHIDKNLLEPIHFLPALSLLISISVLVGCFILPNVFYPILIISSYLILIISIYGSLKYKSIFMIFYLPVIIPIQIFGYGLGFIWAFLNHSILNKRELVGFKKKYYQ
tara:strand:- start:1029 stop:2054 length:1026 start_codon:yes stop_codon:yes gene_type:complete